jgi:hypothetical protein
MSRYDDLEARQTSKPQNRRPLFDAELHLTVNKSYENTVSSITVTVHKLFRDRSLIMGGGGGGGGDKYQILNIFLEPPPIARPLFLRRLYRI